jgi:predicted ATPase
VERLAHHALRGEVWEKALTYGRQAGEKAQARSASREAVVCFEQALAALEHLPDSRAATEQAIDLRLGLRPALNALGEAPGRMLDTCAVPRPSPRRSAINGGSGRSTPS